MSASNLTRLRRIALSAQGLLQAQPFGRGLNGARAAIEHIGYVQLDTISVVERAHHHVLYSRVPNFHPDMANRLLIDGDIFEYWSHAAAFLPIADFRFSLPYKHAIKSGQTHWHKAPDRTLMRQLLKRIRSEGPLRSRDIESTTAKRSGWWDWKPSKKALEQLYMEGDLMVCDRSGFQKTYDLTERVLPANVSTKRPGIREFAEHLLAQQLRCHGLVALKGLTYLRRNAALRKTMKALVADQLQAGVLQQIQAADGEVFFIAAETFEQPMPRVSDRLAILSPFDNSVIQRERLTSIFGFDYQIECYVPASKRQYGYFCLPLLFRDTFVGRMDCKAHRKERRLEIKSLHFDPWDYTDDRVLDAFVAAVKRFSVFQNCDTITVSRVTPKRFLKPLRRAF
ncbi:MAG: winged helix-turn-helix domain-containing protein [Gammaproteobacteria bacterium]